MISFLLAIGLLALGCTKFSQTHYIGIVDRQNGTFQFYRFRLKGNPGLNRVKFVTGWYDADALDSLVEEHQSSFGQSDEQAADETSAGTDETSRQWEKSESFWITGPEGRALPVGDKRFAIVMATDPQPILDAVDKLSEIKPVIEDARKRRKDEKKRKSQLCEALKSALEMSQKADPNDARFSLLGELLPAILGDCPDNTTQKGNGTTSNNPDNSGGG